MKMRKMISLVMSGIIALGGIQIVLAEGINSNISITGYEADLDGMVVYTSEPVSTTELAEALTVTEAGTEVNVNVAEITELTDYNAGNIGDFNNPNAYKITKTTKQKLLSDTIYNVSVNDWEKAFKIETLVSDDFSDGTTNKWKWYHTSISNENTMAVEDGVLNVKIKSGEGSYGTIYTKLVPENYEALAEGNYGGTVEFDIRKISGGSGNACYYGFLPSNAKPDSLDYGLSVLVTEPSKDSIRAMVTKGKADWQEGSKMVTMNNGTFAGNEMMNIKYVFEGDHYVTYLNDKKIIDATTDATLAGALAFAFNIDGEVYEIDNIVWTRVKEIDLSKLTDLSITGYEADLDGMVIYTNEPVPANGLAKALTVTEEGEKLDVDVTAVTKLADYDAANIATFNNPNAYRITKKDNEKLTADAIYNVTVASGLMNSDQTALLKTDWKKVFKIETLLSDDFSDGTTNKWKWRHTSISNSSTMAVENGALRVTAQLGAGSYGLIYSELVPENYEALAERNLGGTVEFDVRKVSDGSGDNDYALYYGFVPTQANHSSLDHGISMIVTEPEKDSIRALVKKGKRDWEDSRIINMSGGTFCGNEMMNIKYIFEDDHYVTYVNDKKIIDETTTDITPTGALAFAFNINGAVYEMDNIIWTRVKEIDYSNLTDISITGYEADLDGMVVYTSQPVSTTELAAALTVTEAGEAVDVDVTSVAKLTDYGVSSISTFNNPNAYKIIKTNNQKLVSDVIYNVTVANGLMNADETAVLKTDWEKTFKIETIISDDFSDGTTNKWKWNYTSSADWQAKSTMEVENGRLKVTAANGPQGGLIETPLVPQNYDTLAEANLGGTVEFDFRKVSDGSGDNDYAFYYGFIPTQANPSSLDYGISMIVTEPNKDSIRALVKKGKRDWEDSRIINMNGGTFCGNEMMNIKYIFENDHYVTYVNDKKIIDETTTDITSTGALAFAFTINGAVYEMDNIVWTRVKELSDSVEIAGINSRTITNNKMSFNVVVNNSFATTKPCKVIVASYGEFEDMKDVWISDVSEVVNGVNTIPVTDLDISEADSIKIFALNNLDEIVPYCEYYPTSTCVE